MRYIDIIIFLAVIIKLILDLVCLCQTVLDYMAVFNLSTCDSLLQLSSSSTGTGFNLPGTYENPNRGGTPGGTALGNPGVAADIFGEYSTNRHMIRVDESWSQIIRSLFIYGTGATRFIINTNRVGTDTQKFIIIVGTLILDHVSIAAHNLINDLNYVSANSRNWRIVLRCRDTSDLTVDPRTSDRIASAINTGSGAEINSSDTELISGSVEPSNSPIEGDIYLEKISESIFNKVVEYLDNIFELIQLSFSNDVLYNQIHNLSILLWILIVFLSIFFFSLLVNIVLYIFSERLAKYFKNRYIVKYLSFNKKVILFEIVMLSSWIFYLLYIIFSGLLILHPIIFPV